MELPQKWLLSFAVWAEGNPIAYAIVSKRRVDEAHLHHFMVTLEQRGQGIGSAMVEEMERRVRRAGCRRLTLKVASDNRGAQQFYARHGYSRSGQDGAYLVLSKALL